MLLNFSVKNFRSFKDEQYLIMQPQQALKEHFDNIITNGKYQCLKCAALFGHNASGKSNMLKALSFMCFQVLSSFRSIGERNSLDYEPFLFNDKTKNEPSEFEIEFLYLDKKYRYGFSQNSNEITEEWLFFTENKPRTREIQLFFRDNEKFETHEKHFRGAKDLPNLTAKSARKRTKNKALFLSVAANYNITEANNVQTWFKNKLVLLDNDMIRMISGYTADNIVNNKNNYKDKIIQFIKKADLAIQDISVKKEKLSLDKIPKALLPLIKKSNNEQLMSFDIVSKHNVFDDNGKCVGTIDVDFEKVESSGTQKYFSIAGPIIDCLENGQTLLIDELEAELHPLLFLYIVKMFNDKETNPKNAQLIFTTHNTDIMDLGKLRRDQIIFFEKDKTEASIVYPLSQFKVRKEVTFSKPYLFGRYGAVPSLPNGYNWWD